MKIEISKEKQAWEIYARTRMCSIRNINEISKIKETNAKTFGKGNSCASLSIEKENWNK